MNLQTIVISEGTTEIDEVAFAGLPALTHVVLPASLCKLGGKTFANCPKLAEINLPARIKEIPHSVFANDISLTEIEIPASVHTIGNSAFWNTGLKQIEIPAGVHRIDDNSFRNAKSLDKVTFQTGSEKGTKSPACVIGEGAFRGTGIVSLEIPARVSTMGAYALADCTMLQSVQVPQTTTMGSGAFWGCQKLANDEDAIVVNHYLFGPVLTSLPSQYDEVLTRTELLTPLAVSPDVSALGTPMYRLPEIVYRPSERSDAPLKREDLVRGNAVAFGRFPTDTDFVLRPLIWRVLAVTDRAALLITERVIMSMLSSRPDDNPSSIYYAPYPKSGWVNSVERKLLNGPFLDIAFSPEEQAQIRETTPRLSRAGQRSRGPENIMDKVLILDKTSLGQYTNAKIVAPFKQACATPYALAQVLPRSERQQSHTRDYTHYREDRPVDFISSTETREHHVVIGIWGGSAYTRESKPYFLRPALWVDLSH